MPLRNGTGPLGSGAGIGRVKGRCKGGLGDNDFRRAMCRGKSGWFIGLAVPVIITAVRDLANSSGLLHKLVRALLLDKKNKRSQNRRDTQYSIVEQNLNKGVQAPKNLYGKSENEYI